MDDDAKRIKRVTTPSEMLQPGARITSSPSILESLSRTDAKGR